MYLTSLLFHHPDRPCRRFQVRLHFVGHSLGGLVARAALPLIAEAEEVEPEALEWRSSGKKGGGGGQRGQGGGGWDGLGWMTWMGWVLMEWNALGLKEIFHNHEHLRILS